MPTTAPIRHRLTGAMSNRLRVSREDAGLTQAEMAARIGISLKTVNNYENPLYHGARKRYVVKDWAEETGREFKELWGNADRQRSVRSGWLRETAA